MTDFDLEAATWDSKSYRTKRAQAVAQGILDHVPVTPQMHAFEYGCGTGLLSFALQPHLGHVSLADNSSGMLAVLDEKISAGGINNMTPLLIDLASDPLPPEKFQLIYTLMTLHHIPDTGKILKAFYNLLDAPGYLCIADLDSEDGSFHGTGFTGHLGFDRAALGKQVRELGFQEVNFTTIYQTPKAVGQSTRYFPVFLMVAKK